LRGSSTVVRLFIGRRVLGFLLYKSFLSVSVQVMTTTPKQSTMYSILRAEEERKVARKGRNELHTVRLFSSSDLSGATGGRCTYLINLGCCSGTGTGTWRGRIGKKMRLEASLFTSGVLRCLFRTPITLGALSCTGCGLVCHVVARAWDMIARSPATRIGITTCSKHNLVSLSFS
jgi:hypothetical protein